MQLHASWSRAGRLLNIWRIDRPHRLFRRVEAIAVHAIDADIGDVGEAAVAGEHHAMRAGTGLLRRRLRLPFVLIDVERIRDSTVALEPKGGDRAAAIVHRDRNTSARIDDNLIRAEATTRDFIDERQTAITSVDRVRTDRVCGYWIGAALPVRRVQKLRVRRDPQLRG